VLIMQVMINGAPIWIADTETKGSKQPPSLFFVHGAGGDASVWNAQVDYFRGKHFTYCIELPGHGRSGGSEKESILKYARWVRLAIEKGVPSKSLVLVGHSMGGAIALEIGTNPPEAVKGIVLIGAGAKLGVLPAIFEMLEKNPDDFFRTMEKAAFGSNTSSAVRERILNVMRKSPPSVIAKDFRACDRFDIRNRLQDIRFPALICCGEEDQLTPVKYSEYLQENLPASRLEVIPQAGHMAMAEQPEALNQALIAFLEEIRSLKE